MVARVVGIALDVERVVCLAQPACVLAGGRPPGAAGCMTVHGILTALGMTAPESDVSFETSAPRCGQSRGEGPAASEFGVGARCPVNSRWAVER